MRSGRYPAPHNTPDRAGAAHFRVRRTALRPPDRLDTGHEDITAVHLVVDRTVGCGYRSLIPAGRRTETTRPVTPYFGVQAGLADAGQPRRQPESPGPPARRQGHPRPPAKSFAVGSCPDNLCSDRPSRLRCGDHPAETAQVGDAAGNDPPLVAKCRRSGRQVEYGPHLPSLAGHLRPAAHIAKFTQTGQDIAVLRLRRAGLVTEKPERAPDCPVQRDGG